MCKGGGAILAESCLSKDCPSVFQIWYSKLQKKWTMSSSHLLLESGPFCPSSRIPPPCLFQYLPCRCAVFLACGGQVLPTMLPSGCGEQPEEALFTRVYVIPKQPAHVTPLTQPLLAEVVTQPCAAVSVSCKHSF